MLPPSPGTFRALRHRDFRLLWSTQLVSLTGTWMHSVAQGWLVLRLSDSVFWLGVVAFCNYLPFFLLSLAGGVAADRFSRRRALGWTQGTAMALALALALGSAWGKVGVGHLCLFALALGIVTAFDIPVRQALLQDLVGREDLQNAIALNSAAFNVARFAGPAVAGYVVARWGEALCFLLNGVSYLPVLAGLAAMRVRDHPREEMTWMAGAREAVRFAWSEPRARSVLMLVGVSSLFGAPYAVLLPAYVRDVLGGEAVVLGHLTAASGLGALLGALLLARRASTRGAGGWIAAAMALFGSGLLSLAVARHPAAAGWGLVLVGGSLVVQLGASNAFLQLLAPERLRGRAVSLYMLAFIGMAPFGSLLGGTAARLLGVPGALAAGGAACVLGAAAFATRIFPLGAGGSTRGIG